MKEYDKFTTIITQWILVEFAGSLEENILMIKVRTKREWSPRTWRLDIDLFCFLFSSFCWAGKRRRRIPAVSRIKLKLTEHAEQIAPREMAKKLQGYTA